MAWDPVKKGHYCDRCGQHISIVYRQDKYMNMPVKGGKYAGDPYVSIIYHAFFEEEKRFRFSLEAPIYCYACEKGLYEALQAYNKTFIKEAVQLPPAGPSQGNSDGDAAKQVLLLHADPPKPVETVPEPGVHATGSDNQKAGPGAGEAEG